MAALTDKPLKLIILGDSAVGKTKLLERFLMGSYSPINLSTYALTLYKKDVEVDGRMLSVDLWDTAGQERFANMHPAYYDCADACILVFDCTRKTTYQNLERWHRELREYCPSVPCILCCNKIDIDRCRETRICYLLNWGRVF